jgi:YD repeat-containing protein
MKKRLIIITLFIYGIGLHVFSQSLEKYPLPKPLPPNAASLFKVLERPVGSYTGTVPVNIPVCAVSSGALTADVSLNYNSTGGIKVEEIGGSAGLGWSLSDGAGRITQMVKGLPDDMGGMLNPGTGVKPSTFNSQNQGHLEWVAMKAIDLEPDVYYFNFLGRSGRFFFKENGSIVMMDNVGLKITYDTYSISAPPYAPYIRRWVVTDEHGAKYYFGQNKANAGEVKTYNTSGNDISSRSWYLTEAYDINEENKITYTYIASGGLMTTFAGGSHPLFFYSNECQGFDTYTQTDVITTDAGEFLVSRIDANNGSIVFQTVLDYSYGPRRVTAIEQYDQNNSLVKFFHLNYGIFARGSPKLKSFSEFGISPADSITTEFEYEELQYLPGNLSTSVDYWGFYNGVYNGSVFPNTNAYFQTAFGNTRRVEDIYADRNPNPGYAEANILKKIKYPTGGSREFIYEGNTVLTSENLNQYHPDPDYTVNQSFSETQFTNYGNGNYPSMQHCFTVNSNDGGAKFYYYLNGLNSFCNNYQVKIVKTTSPCDLQDGFDIWTFNNDPSGSWIIENGYYRVDVYVTDPYFACTISSLEGSWKECSISTQTITTPHGDYQVNNRKAGGLRMKEIKDYDPATNQYSSTFYYYKLYSTDSTYTSGLLVSKPQFVEIENDGTPEYAKCVYARLIPQSSYPLAAEGGSYVVYPEVRTVTPGNGRIDHTFSYQMDYPTGGFPYGPMVDNSIYRGKPVKETYFTDAGIKNLEKTYTYAYGNEGGQVGIKTKIYWQMNCSYCVYYIPPYVFSETKPAPSGGFDDIADMAAQNMYGIDGFRCLVESETTTQYSNGNPLSATVTTDYSFHNGYWVPSNTKTTLSNGQTLEKVNNYTFTPPSSFSFGLSQAEINTKDQLLTANIIEPIEQVEQVKNGSTLVGIRGGAKLIYNISGGKYRLSSLKKFSGTTLASQTDYGQFNTYGMPQEYTVLNQPSQVVLYGYKNLYPVAQVTGSSYSAVSALVNPSVLYTPSSNVTLRTELDKIHSGLAGVKALVTTSIYDTRYGIASVKEPSGKLLSYGYDGFGRLMMVKDQNDNVLKKYCYNYNGKTPNCTLHGNGATSGNFIKNDCTNGQQGSNTVTYPVVANKYYATTQTEADAMAQADINTNGQAYANANGSCAWFNDEKSGQFTKNDCGSGYTGSTETYIVPAHTYSSTVNQATADALAQNDVDNNGQNFANSYGSCTEDNITLYYNNAYYAYYPIYFTFTNLNTYQQYNFQTDWYGYSGTLGQLPPGYYEVEIYNPYNYGYHYYETNCYDYTWGYTYAYMYFATFDTYCNTITIY